MVSAYVRFALAGANMNSVDLRSSGVQQSCYPA